MDRGKVLLRHQDWVESVAWSPDGRWLASGTRGNRIVVCDGTTGQIQWTALVFLMKDNGTVTFSPSGEILYGDPDVIEKELVYLIEKPSGALELLKPSEFQKRVAAATK